MAAFSAILSFNFKRCVSTIFKTQTRPVVNAESQSHFAARHWVVVSLFRSKHFALNPLRTFARSLDFGPFCFQSLAHTFFCKLLRITYIPKYGGYGVPSSKFNGHTKTKG